MGFSWRKTFKTKQTRKPKCLSAFDVEHAQCLTGYHVFMVSGLDLARAPRRARLTARKKGSGYENARDHNTYCQNGSLLTDVVVLTPSDEILPSAYPSAKLNSLCFSRANHLAVFKNIRANWKPPYILRD